MIQDISYLIRKNEKLTKENKTVHNKLNEALDIIDAIRDGNIDAVFSSNNKAGNVIISRTADATFRTFIENMSEGVVTLHSDGIILYSNSSFAKIINLSIKKVVGANIRSFIPEEYIEKFERLFVKFPANNSKLELSILNRKTKRRHFIVSLNKLQLQDFVALNLVWTDVTEQKQAEEKLISLNKNLKKAIEERINSENTVVDLNNKLKENIKTLEEANIELATFAHVASHDLQEPLRKIITYSGMLINDYHDIIDQQGQNYINLMQNSSERMRNLINDILEYSGLVRKDFLFKSTNLQSVLDELISNLEIVIHETKATITIEKQLPVIEANTGQMKQLFQNLISNSLKFIKNGTIPKINISYEIVKGSSIENVAENMLNEKFYRFYVRDNGIGFKPEYKNKIFTIFQRLNTNSTYQGTGIGLAICKKIVEQHNGFIIAEGKLNEGSLFTITLPVSHIIGK